MNQNSAKKTKGPARNSRPLPVHTQDRSKANSGQTRNSDQLLRAEPSSRAWVAAKAAEAERREKLAAPVVHTSASKRLRLLQLKEQMRGNSTEVQCECTRVALMSIGPLTTHEMRQHLDIVAPASRIFDLRSQGHQIVTQWVRQKTEVGRLHRFARYVLLRGKA